MHWKDLLNDLPDFSGILLAAIGAAVMFAPEAIKWLENKRAVRFVVAAFFVLMGVGGLISGHIQRKASDTAQANLNRRIQDLEQAQRETKTSVAEANVGIGAANVGIHQLLENSRPAVRAEHQPKQTVKKAPVAVPTPSPAAQVPSRRALSEEDINKLKKLLDPIRGPTGTVEITCILGDGEGCRYAYELLNALKVSLWTAEGVSQSVFTQPIQGILIQVRSPTVRGAGRLQKALLGIGVDAKGALNPNMPADRIELVVGYKPD